MPAPALRLTVPSRYDRAKGNTWRTAPTVVLPAQHPVPAAVVCRTGAWPGGRPSAAARHRERSKSVQGCDAEQHGDSRELDRFRSHCDGDEDVLVAF
jgi:hypothetical protein